MQQLYFGKDGVQEATLVEIETAEVVAQDLPALLVTVKLLKHAPINEVIAEAIELIRPRTGVMSGVLLLVKGPPVTALIMAVVSVVIGYFKVVAIYDDELAGYVVSANLGHVAAYRLGEVIPADKVR